MSEIGTGAKRRRRRGGGSSGNAGSPSAGYATATAVPPATGQSPSILPSNQQPLTHGSSAARDPTNVFPFAPYVPVSELTMQQQLRDCLAAPLPKRPQTVVAASRFAHYQPISNIEDEPKPAVLNPEFRTQAYHSVNRYSGKHMLLRRFVDHDVPADVCAAVCETLRHFRHPNLVSLHAVIPTSEFVLGHNDVLMEYRYIRGARTLDEVFIRGDGVVTEALLWSIACQLTGLIRAFHEAGVPLRGLHLTKILFLELGQRVMFSGLGLKDIIAGGPVGKESREPAMRGDVISLGLVLLKLATRNAEAINAEPLQRLTTVTPVLAHFIATCVDGNAKVDDLCRGLGERMSMEVGQQLGHVDLLLHECAKELHNGRLMKLLIKLNFAYAAAHSSVFDPADAFVIQTLFAYLFVQVEDQDQPKYDWGHVYYCLNKLDTGSGDVVQLVGTNGDSLILLTWRDLRVLLDKMTAHMTHKDAEAL